MRGKAARLGICRNATPDVLYYEKSTTSIGVQAADFDFARECDRMIVAMESILQVQDGDLWFLFWAAGPAGGFLHAANGKNARAARAAPGTFAQGAPRAHASRRAQAGAGCAISSSAACAASSSAGFAGASAANSVMFSQ